MIDRGEKVPVKRQAELLELSCFSAYYDGETDRQCLG